MDKELYRIGEIAELLNISVQAIRHYQKKGLIEPSFVDEDTKYRYFDGKNVSEIWQISVLQSAGFSLDEIFKLRSLDEKALEKKIKEKKEKLKKEIHQKEISLNYLERQQLAMRLRNDDTLDFKYFWLEHRYGYPLYIPDEWVGNERLRVINSLKGTYGLNHVVTYQPSRRLSIVDGSLKLDYLLAIEENGHSDDQMVRQDEGFYLCALVRERSQKDDIIKKMISIAQKDGYQLRGDVVEILLMDENLTTHAGAYLREIQMALIKST